MSRAIVEFVLDMEINDQGGVTSLDQLATVAQTLLNAPTAHPWLVNSSWKAGYIQSGDIPGASSGGVVTPVG